MFDQTRGQHIDRPGGYIKNTGGPLLFSTGWAKQKMARTNGQSAGKELVFVLFLVCHQIFFASPQLSTKTGK